MHKWRKLRFTHMRTSVTTPLPRVDLDHSPSSEMSHLREVTITLTTVCIRESYTANSLTPSSNNCFSPFVTQNHAEVCAFGISCF